MPRCASEDLPRPTGDSVFDRAYAVYFIEAITHGEIVAGRFFSTITSRDKIAIFDHSIEWKRQRGSIGLRVHGLERVVRYIKG